MSNTTDHFESLYIMHRRALKDLNRLGRDFGDAIAERAPQYTEGEEYSYGGISLVLRKCHTWLTYRPIEEDLPAAHRVFSFAACVAYFEADAGRWKLTPCGRPELWFFMGTASPPPTDNKAWIIQTFFNEVDLPLFTPKPALGGKISRYSANDADGRWEAVALGHELGTITSGDELLNRAVDPLLNAAREARIA
jgi:hypothetical protein